MVFVRILIRSILVFYILFCALLVYQGADGDLFKTAERFFQNTHFITGVIDYYTYSSACFGHNYCNFFSLQIKFASMVFLVIYSILLIVGLYRILYDKKVYEVNDDNESEIIHNILYVETGCVLFRSSTLYVEIGSVLFRGVPLKEKETKKEDKSVRMERKTFRQLMGKETPNVGICMVFIYVMAIMLCFWLCFWLFFVKYGTPVLFEYWTPATESSIPFIYKLYSILLSLILANFSVAFYTAMFYETILSYSPFFITKRLKHTN